MRTPKLVECASVPCYLTEAQAKQVDLIVKTLPTSHQFKRKMVSSESTIDQTERTDVSYISTIAVDRDKDIILPDGFDLSQYSENKIVLYQHDQSQPIAKCLWLKPDSKGVLAKTMYPTKPSKFDGDWQTDKIWGLVQCGVLKGKSVGILPLDIEEPTEEQAALGAECIITKSLLLEYSVVAIPCCPEALVQAIEKGLALDVLGIQRTGKRVTPKVVKQVVKNRVPQLLERLKLISFDPDVLAEKVVEQIRNKGRIN